MEERERISRLARMPAWGLSLITLLVLFTVLRIAHDPKSTSLNTIQIVVWICYVILLSVACFIICRTHPKSLWYTPVICNAIYLIGLVANTILTIVDPDYGTSSTEWIIIASSIVISFTAAFVGARMGRRKTIQAK